MVTVALYVASLVARNSELLITAWVLEASSIIGAAVLALAFHSEVRYAIVRFNALFRLWPAENGVIGGWNQAVTDAAFALAETKTGALIVILGRVPIADLTTPGIRVRADLSKELLQSIFHKGSPLHDGAVVIEDGRLARTNVVLPLSEADNLPAHYGTRHRAGIGLAEHTDAMIIVISEERGEISFMRSGRTTRIQHPDQLLRRLSATQPHIARDFKRALSRVFLSDPKVKLVSAVLAAFVCLASAMYDRTSVRVVSVPIQFTDVPRGMDLLGQSTPNVILQLRGNHWSLDGARLSRLVAHFSISGTAAGVRRFTVTSGSVDLPPGVTFESATPPEVTIQVVRSGLGGS